MSRILQILVLLSVFGGAAALVPTTTNADDYWSGYWGWYDNTYRPYYHRYYSYRPFDYYGPYAYPRYDGYYDYGPGYYGNYGYRDYDYHGGQIQIGPYRFGWR